MAAFFGNATFAAIDYELVTVGHPGNASDTTGFGGVGYEYKVGKYPVTIGQYAAFLNAVATTDTYGLYDTQVATNLNIAGIARSGTSGSFVYSVMNNSGDSSHRPITRVSWFNAARFANWLTNGQPTGGQIAATTEDGAYALNGIVSGSAVGRNAVNPNTGSGVTFYIPLENEWYKAAYFSPNLNSGSGGYYTYATQSNVVPGNAIGSTPNQANYYIGVYPNGSYATGGGAVSAAKNYLTDVGAFRGSASYYGTFDQNGNVYQWNDLDGAAGPYRGLRGGAWNPASAADLASGRRLEVAPTSVGSLGGFRLAGPVDVPFARTIDVVSGLRTQQETGYVQLSGSFPLIKVGLGTLLLDQINTFTGSTSIQQGILAISNTAAISSSPLVSFASGASFDVSALSGGYTVPSGQTIAGSGTVLGSVTFGRGSTLSPGSFSAASGASMLAADTQAGSLQALVVPEPAALGMVGVGLGFLGLGALRRKRVA